MTDRTATTPTHSDAAGKYTAGIDPLVFLNWGVVRAAFDAGAASATVPAEPIITEAARDALPVGAVLARFHTDGHGPSVFVRSSEGWLMATERASVLIYPDGRDSVGNRMAPLTLLAPASPPVPAPVLLTADDPRWRDGAKVRGEWPDGSVCEGWLQTRTRTCATYCTMPSPRLRSLNSTTTNSTTFSATSALLATTS